MQNSADTRTKGIIPCPQCTVRIQLALKLDLLLSSKFYCYTLMHERC